MKVGESERESNRETNDQIPKGRRVARAEHVPSSVLQGQRPDCANVKAEKFKPKK